jgi:hypothetical protein
LIFDAGREFKALSTLCAKVQLRAVRAGQTRRLRSHSQAITEMTFSSVIFKHTQSAQPLAQKS